MTVHIGGNDFVVRQEQGALIFPGQPHAFFSPQSNRSWLMIFSEEYLPELHTATQRRFPILNIAQSNLFTRLNACKNDYFRLKSLLYEVAALYNDGALYNDFYPENDTLVCNIVNYIDAHFTEPLSLRRLSEHFGYNYRYMSGIFNRFFKTSFPTLLNQYRVNYACKLLREAEYSITEVAQCSGFDSLRNFNRCFKNLTGVVPREYAAKTR